MNNSNDDEQSPWGTWEDLLLAFAVNRHGAAAWDSIAAELQKRTSASLSAQNCRLKYLDLRRRYGGDDGENGGGDDRSSSLLEELRKVRVAELRREVQRYDLNIESLETKMKSMAEERQREKTDLEKVDDKSDEPEEKGGDGEPVAEDSEKVDSTDLGSDKMDSTPKPAEPVQNPAEECHEPGEDLKKPVRADSCNGSSNSIEKALNRNKKSDSAESNEPVKDNSDVQSSASRSREEEEKEGNDKLRRGSTASGGDDQSRGNVVKEEVTGETRWFVDFLQAVRSCHKFGSVVERRLRSQESSKYQKLVLQHMDLETIETRLKEGWYSGPRTKFFRDLLLLVNNALVFFNKNSPEAKSAIEVRRLISKEMTPKSTKSDSSSGKQVSLQSLSAARKDEPMLKPGMCRKRTSITKASASSEKKKEQTAPLIQDKDSKPQHSGNSEERKYTKKRTRDRLSPPLPAKKNGKAPPKSNGGNKGSLESGKQTTIKGGSSSHSDSKTDSKRTPSTVDSKKRSNFFKDDSRLVDALKSTPFTSEKKSETAKRGEKKEPVSKRGSETKQVKGSPEKKNIGRPPKRGAPPPPPTSLGKRGRDRGEVESAGGGGSSSKQQPRKRTRKL